MKEEKSYPMEVEDFFDRPKIKIETTKSEWIWNFIGYSFFITALVFLAITWSKIPDEIPIHFNEFGFVTRVGTKGAYFMMTVIAGVFLPMLMQILERFPEMYIYPKRFNDSNAREFYLVSRKMTYQFKNIVLLIFSYHIMNNISIALDWKSNLDAFFLPISVIAISVPVIIAIVKYHKIK